MIPDRRSGLDRRSEVRTTPDRRGGRPRSPIQKSSVSAWIEADQHDKLIQIAQRREMSVSALISRVITIALSKQPASSPTE